MHLHTYVWYLEYFVQYWESDDTWHFETFLLLFNQNYCSISESLFQSSHLSVRHTSSLSTPSYLQVPCQSATTYSSKYKLWLQNEDVPTKQEFLVSSWICSKVQTSIQFNFFARKSITYLHYKILYGQSCSFYIFQSFLILHAHNFQK